MTAAPPDPSDLFGTPYESAAADFAARVQAAVLGAQEVQAMHLGDRLGWYRELALTGPLTSSQLASRTGTDERYAREWLEHQAACGYVAVDDVTADASARRFRLPVGHAEVLCDEDSLLYLAPLARITAATSQQLPALLEAYRAGGGVSWATFGPDAREAQGAANRPLFLHQLAQQLLPAVPDLDARLRAGARVADVGCGEGWSSIGLALGYPAVTVTGFDVDEPSLEAARRHAEDAGVTDRVSFVGGDAATAAGTFDVVLAVECIHDMPDPVSVLAGMRRLAGRDGAVVVVDERTQEEFTAPADPWERILYGWSITCCLPDGRSGGPSVETGTVMRPATMARYAAEAGFGRTEILPIEHDAFRFYRLHV